MLVLDETAATLRHAIRYNRGTGRGETRARMPNHLAQPSASAPDAECRTGPSDRLLLAAAGGAALWVLAWVTVQLPGVLGRSLPLLAWFR